MHVYQIKIQGQTESLYVYAGIQAAAEQRGRVLARVLFNTSKPSSAYKVAYPIKSQELLAAQMAVVLGEKPPVVQDKVQVQQASLWGALAAELQGAGL